MLLLVVLAGCAEVLSGQEAETRKYQREQEVQRDAADAPASAPTPAARTSAAAPVSLPARAQVLLRLHGSNTIGSALAPTLAAEFLRAEGGRDVHPVRDSGANRTWILGTRGQHPVAIEVWAPGSKVGFESLGAGRCDVGLASRAISPEEAEGLSALGDLTAPKSEHVLALDGVAVVVNGANKVTALPLDKLAQIFTGELHDWSQAGGQPGPINLYARDGNSGTYETFSHLVLHGRPLAAGARRFEDSTALADAVAADANGIGFVALPYVHQTRALAIQEAQARPLYPTVFTVATEDYPLSRRLLLYTAAKSENALTARFVSFALSNAGQRLVEEAGFIPLTVHAQAVKPSENAPEKYVKATRDSLRVSVNFRFKKGSSVLDAKGFQDVDNLIKFLASSPLRSKQLLLFGFADWSGKETINLTLSKQRADTVAVELRQHGLSPEDVDGFGSALPLVANDSPEGRLRNRRVEVWLK